MRHWILVVMVAALAAAEPPALTVLTWNVLADPTHAGQRLPAILAEIQRVQPDIIALQEVAPWMRAEIQRSAVFREYRLTVLGGRVDAPGGVFLAARSEVRNPRVVVIPSRQDRCALVADLDTPIGTLRVATVHLESFLHDGPIRAAQLRAVGQALEGAEHAMLLGDCNFGDGEEPDTSAVPAGFADLWRQLKGDEPGFTWDRQRNALADAGSFPNEASRRLDRIFLRSSRWQPAAMDVVGTQPVAGQEGLHPSDHFGLCVRLIAAP